LASNAVPKYDDLPTFGHSQDEWLEASSDLHDMMELGELEEVKSEAVNIDENSNDHQALIDEVELFLTHHETSSAMPSEDLPLEVKKTLTIVKLEGSLFKELFKYNA
jgi:hypothetical protein